jgi:cyclic GMP-AMP synthase
MTWNFHRYFAERDEGLIGQLTLGQEERDRLILLRKKVRGRIRDTFEEAKSLARETKATGLSMQSAKERIAVSRFKHLSLAAQDEIALLLVQMNDTVREAFLSLKPRFWTQGSFQYNTLNRPYQTPPQEMDIDDGTYLPMAIFEDEPIIGHRFLQLVVDSALQSLVAENEGWEFQPKRTCARIKIAGADTHVDVPMYAIPENQFREKELALEALKSEARGSQTNFTDAIAVNRADYELDSNCVNLAIREGEKKWMKSDPKIVEDWFEECRNRIGSHLPKLCRFMKAWRDVQWPQGGGPSSIALMAATVNVLDREPTNSNDFGAAMKVLSKNLPSEFEQGIESPDPSDDRPLFPSREEHDAEQSMILKRLQQLASILEDAETATTKRMAIETLNRAFGNRVVNPELIVQSKSAPAFSEEPEKATKATTISSSMVSGLIKP